MPSLVDNPQWFGHYRLTSRIATGGMAELYVGRHVSPDGTMGPMVAVKRLLPHLVKETFIVQMFLNEARITAQIHHPNVVQVVDLGHEGGEPFIVMELLEGRSFSDMRAKAAESAKHVPLGITLRVLVEACRGLDAAHRAVDEKGRQLCIVHRDFTPDNIHVGVEGDVKVIDFGIAKAENLSAGTEPGTLKGKFFYMSPEMIAGRPVDHRADIFAAGVMLYEQLCGRRPFTGSSPDEVLQRIAEGNQKRPTEFDPSVPQALEAICLMALAPKPDRRFASLDEFIRAIDAVGGTASVATTEEVGTYVNELFPLEKDPKRLTLRRARQADPSQAQARMHDGQGLPVASAPGAPLGGNVLGRISAILQRLRLTSFALGAGSVAVGVGLVVLILSWPKLFPTKTVAERLDEAAALTAPGPREKALKAISDEPMASPVQLRRACQLLLEASQYDSALTAAERFVARFPKDPSARLLEARACIGLRQGKRAEVALEEASALNPADPQPDLVLADLKEMQGDDAGALEALSRAAKKQPSRTLSARRGYLLSQAGRLDEASDALNGLLQTKFDPDAAAELAFVRYRQNQLPEAISLLKRALKADPNLSKAQYYLGAVLYRQGDAKGAEHAYREADRLAPQDPRALVALCQVQTGTEQGKAADETRKAIAERFAAQAATLKQQCP